METAVKELIDNSIDSNCTHIDLKVCLGSSLSIECTDNGSGILDLTNVCLPNYTSKSFQDLGYKGLGLFSLCDASNGHLTIESQFKHEQRTVSAFSRSGAAISSTVLDLEEGAGTIVKVMNMFASYPVRLKTMLSAKKKQYDRIFNLIRSYSVFYPGIEISSTLYADDKKLFARQRYVATETMFQAAQLAFKVPVVQCPLIEENGKSFEIFYAMAPALSINGKHLCLVLVNGRPYNVDWGRTLTPMFQRISDKAHDTKKLLIVRVETHKIEDSNFSSTKTQLEPKLEELILTKISVALLTHDTASKIYTGAIHSQVDVPACGEKAGQLLLSDFAAVSNLRPTDRNPSGDVTSESVTKNFASVNLRHLVSPVRPTCSASFDQPVCTKPMSANTSAPPVLIKPERHLRAHSEAPELVKTSSGLRNVDLTRRPLNGPFAVEHSFNEHQQQMLPWQTTNRNSAVNRKRFFDPHSIDHFSLESTNPAKILRVDKPSPSEPPQIDNHEYEASEKHSTIEVSQNNESHVRLEPSAGKCSRGIRTWSFFDPNDTYHLEKVDLGELKLIGQLNKSLILTNYTKEKKTFLFAIDQHAIDEKYKFETFFLNLDFKSQPLIRAAEVSLTGSQVLILSSHEEYIKSLGFLWATSGENNVIKISSVPYVMDTVCKVSEIIDILDILNDVSGHIRIRDDSDFSEEVNMNDFPLKPRSVWKKCASKACRSAVMMGDDLTKTKMSELLVNLSKTRHPWNCPHGRPTITCLGSFN